MKVVVDASVAAKWFLRDPAHDEPHVPAAVRLLERIAEGTIECLQPPHWTAEVMAVIVRRIPDQADTVLGLLLGLELPEDDDPAIYLRALQLSRELGHHLFDTLYHAVALEHGALLLTANRAYHRKARTVGAIELLDSATL